MSFEIGGWILVLLGAALAFTGKRLVWLAVGIAGFGLGWLFTLAFFPSASALATFLAGLVLGAVGAVVALRGLPLLVSAAGAVLVGLLGFSVLGQLTSTNQFWEIVGFVIGAVVGVFLVRASLEWGIPLVTAIGGAALVWNGVTKALPDLPAWLPVLVALAIGVGGFVVQLRTAPSSDVVTAT